MALQRQNFKLYSANSRDLIFNVAGADDLSGIWFAFALSRTRDSVPTLFKQSGITVEGTTVRVPLTTQDTYDLHGNYIHQLLLVDPGGHITIVSEGLVRVLDSTFKYSGGS